MRVEEGEIVKNFVIGFSYLIARRCEKTRPSAFGIIP